MPALAAQELGIDLKEGVYQFFSGPNFETPAEVRFARLCGADAVGMSTVPEVIAANHAKMEVLGISCMTNMAAGILENPLSHQEVLETGERVKLSFSALVRSIVKKWPLE
ncbi:MAG: purine-nucleoside phosphorylase [Sphaerochaetaceae bacterium]